MNVELEESAWEDLKRLGPEVARRVLDKLEWLKQHPEPQRLLKRLEGTDPPSYRFSIRDWRAIGQIREDTFYVRLVDHRSKVYSRLER